MAETTVGRWNFWWAWDVLSWTLWVGRIPQPSRDLWTVIIGPLQITRMNYPRPTLKEKD